jgi:hypothetical protein
MTKERILKEEPKVKPRKAEHEVAEHQPPAAEARSGGLTGLHRHIGNQGVQRMLAQRSGQGATELDDETAKRIDGARGSGRPLDASVQESVGTAMGQDFSGVQVHTSPESDSLNKQLGAKAFTTGQDVFFGAGAYQPHTKDGQELIAHELTHVAQQGSGAASGGGRMTVNAPGDAYEQEADSVASSMISNQSGSQAQRQEEEEVMPKAVQRQEEEEEMAMAKAVQRQEMPEEDELQMQALQRQEEEEEVMPKAVQRQEMPEEDELQMQILQRQIEEEEEMPAQTKAVQRQEELPEEEV